MRLAHLETLKLSDNGIRRVEAVVRVQRERSGAASRKQLNQVVRHVESAPEIYSREKVKQIRAELLEATDRFGKQTQTLRESMPELTVLDLSGNHLKAKDILRLLPDKLEWVVDLDLRRNGLTEDALGQIRAQLPFLEVYNGEVITEIGYSTKCKIKELGGDWEAPAEAAQPEPVEVAPEDCAEMEYFENFEDEMRQQRTKVDVTFQIFREKMSRIEDMPERTFFDEKIDGAKREMDEFITQAKGQMQRKLLDSSKAPGTNEDKENDPKRPKRREKGKTRTRKREPRTRFSKKSGFKILRLGTKRFNGRTKAQVREQNEAVRRMLMSDK